MVYKVLLTQPLAAGPEGDWTQDVLMEGIPMTIFPFSTDTITIAHASTKDISNRASGVHGSVLEFSNEAEISISEDDDEDEDYGDDHGDDGDVGDVGEASDIESTGEMAIRSIDAERKSGSSVRSEDVGVNCYSADAGLDTMYHVEKNVHQADTKEESVDGDSSSSDFADGLGDANKVARRRGEDKPASPRNIRVSRESSNSPGIESIDIDEDRESDSSFDGSDDDDNVSDDEAEDADDSDSYEPDVPYPPCSLHHQDRKTHKQSLCEECYIKYKGDLKAAGLYSGSDEEPGPEKRRRKKQVAKTKRRGRQNITSPHYSTRRGKEHTSGTDKRNLNARRTTIPNSRAGAVALRNRGRKREESESTSKKRRAGNEEQRHRLNKEQTSLSGDTLPTGRADSNDSSNDDSSSDTNGKARANAGNRLRVIKQPTRRKTSALTLSDNGVGVAPDLLSIDSEPMDTEESFELTNDGIRRNEQKVEGSERTLRCSGSRAKEASKKPETAGVQGAKLSGQSAKSKATDLVPEGGVHQMVERKTSDALLQPKNIDIETVEAPSLCPRSQFKRGESLDTAGQSETAGMTGKVGRADGSARDGNLSNIAASCALNEPMHLNTKVPEKSGVGRLEKRKSGFSGQIGSKTGKKARTTVSGNSVMPTSRATYERVTHYLGVVRKVTIGKFFLWVGDKLHDGKPYDSAEECAREYDKLQTANSRGGQFRPRLNFGDPTAPLHMETIGLTALSAGPGSRIAKIKSGYRVPNTTGQKPAPKKGGPFFAPSSALRKTQQNQQSHATARSTPVETPPSNSLNIDLPMVRSSKASAESIPSFMPPDGSKIRWLNPISRERPLDGLHLPCAAWAAPARSAMKGGRQAHLVRAALITGPTDSAMAIVGGADRGQVQPEGVKKLTSHRADGNKLEGKAVEADTRAHVPPVRVKPSSARGSVAMVGVKHGSAGLPIGTAAQGCTPPLGAETETQPSSMSMSTSEPSGVRVPAIAVSPTSLPDAHAILLDTAGKVVASASRPSMEVSVNAAAVQGERQDGELDLSDDSSDCALDATTQMDHAPSPSPLASAGSVPLRDHLAQMRHNAASQVHTSPWGQAEAKEGGKSGAEERGQEALLRWMHQGTENCSDDRGKGGAEGVDVHAQDQVTSSFPRPNGLAAKDADEHLASCQSAGGDLDLDSDSSGEEGGEDEEDDLAEYENLCTKIAEISRDVGALPPIVPRTTSPVVEDFDDELSPAPYFPDYVVPSYGQNAHPRVYFPTAPPLPARDPQCERASVPKPLDASVTAVAQRASHASSNDAFKAPDTARGDSDKTQADLAGQHSPVSPHLLPSAVTDAPAKTAGADAVNKRDGIEATDPSVAFRPLAWQAAEDFTEELRPLKPQVQWAPPSRFTRAHSAPKPQGTDAIETTVRDEPPLVPRVSWRPPARISRTTGTRSSAPAPQPGQPQSPMQPQRVRWVTPRALRAPPKAAWCNAPRAKTSQPLSQGIALPKPNHDNNQNGQSDCKSTLDRPEIDEQVDAVKNHASSLGASLSERERPQDMDYGSAQATVEGRAQHSVKNNNVNGSRASGSGCGGGDVAKSLGVETTRSRSRSNDSRRSSSTRRQPKSRSPTKQRDYRQSGRERHGHDRRSPDDILMGRYPSATSGSRCKGRDSRTTRRHSRGSRDRGDEVRDRERERRGTTRDHYLRDDPGRGGDKRDEPGRGGGKRDEPGRGGDKRDKPGRGGDTRNPHHCDGHDKGIAEVRLMDRGPHPNGWPRRSDHHQGIASSADPGDGVGRGPRGECPSSGDDERR